VAAGTWDAARQAFADQFEQDQSGFVYRRSQKGEAIRVSAEERQKFIDGFDRALSYGMFLMIAGVILIIGGMAVLSTLDGWDLPQGVIVTVMVATTIPYFAYYRWAWGAPSRALGGRTPIASERSRDEVRQLQFQRVTYGGLAAAAAGGLAIPLIGSSQQDVFSGWGRLWLAGGAALALFAGVQAFRKWRFEQDNPDLRPVQAASVPFFAKSFGEAAVEARAAKSKTSFWRYVPLALIVLGIAFIAYTAAGKRLAHEPLFWPALMVALGGWVLFTVAKGFTKGEIEPFARGFYNAFERETQPKRFWASMAWNTILGCMCLWGAFQMTAHPGTEDIQDRCYNEQGTYSSGDVTSACNQLLEDSSAAINARPDDATAYFNRGYAYEHRGDLQHAIADFSEVIRLRPNDSGAYYYRWAAYKDSGDDEQAAADLATMSRLDPKLAAEIRRGS
jgi:tetratricopeptide (TPR) repeat protein